MSFVPRVSRTFAKNFIINIKVAEGYHCRIRKIIQSDNGKRPKVLSYNPIEADKFCTAVVNVGTLKCCNSREVRPTHVLRPFFSLLTDARTLIYFSAHV